MTAPALSLYIGRTRHSRREPKPHSFSYGVFQILIDVDHVAEAFKGLRTLRHGRWGLFSFAERDHGAREDTPLRSWVERQLAAVGVKASAHSIRLLCFPRMLGFVFNPISIFYIEDDQGRLEAVIYEVNNTFGQTHAYVVPAHGLAEERHEADKALYVSPFYRIEGGYRFRLTPPSETLRLMITKQVGGRPDFVANLNAKRVLATDGAFLKLFFVMPLMTLGVVAAIHWEAIRLWIKGAPFRHRPPGPRASLSLGRTS
jgi:DUF1365 family protein